MYTRFAEVYEEFMDNVPYDEWCEFITGILKENNKPQGKILDLGCGTGSMARRLYDKGYSVTGVDLSEDMLKVARKESDAGIIYTIGDMRNYTCDEKADAAVCICDALNYLLKAEYVEETFKKTYENLKDDGIFIFDINTLYKFQYILGDSMICENREDACLSWENYFDAETMIHEYAVNFFIREDDGRYFRHEEFHYQKGYTYKCIVSLLKKAGFKVQKVYDAMTLEDRSRTSEKIFFVCSKIV